MSNPSNRGDPETIDTLEIQRASRCPYVNCKLNCRSKRSHRARYAYLKLMSESSGQVKTGASIKIDYQKLRALRAKAVSRVEKAPDVDDVESQDEDRDAEPTS